MSICVPTYNRAPFIKRLLTFFEEEIDANDLADEVEICISDNCSIDNTYNIINNSKLRIIYNKNKENIGADKNYLKSVELASGEYCWLLGSDDLIRPNSLREILCFLRNCNEDIFLFDRDNVYKNREKRERWHYIPILVNSDNLVKYIQNLASIGGLFSYISSIIFKRQKWNEITFAKSKSIKRYVGSCYIHVFILAEIIKNRGVLNYLGRSFVLNTVNNDSFLAGDYLNRVLIDFNYIDIFHEVFHSKDIDREVIKLLNRERNIFHFLKAKFYTAALDKEKLEILLSYCSKLRKYFVIFFPKILIKLLLFLHNFIRNFVRSI